jgi:hypothetical protein
MSAPSASGVGPSMVCPFSVVPQRVRRDVDVPMHVLLDRQGVVRLYREP